MSINVDTTIFCLNFLLILLHNKESCVSNELNIVIVIYLLFFYLLGLKLGESTPPKF